MGVLDKTRRRLIQAAGSLTIIGLAGCAGGDGGDGEEEELPGGVSEEEFVSGPVPEEYRTATSQGGEARDPDALTTKAAAKFKEAEAAVESGVATEGRSCDNCEDYIPDKNGDEFGACSAVEGYIDPEDWCALWEPLEEGS